MPSAHHLSKQNIWAKFHENPVRTLLDIEQTQKCYGQTDRQTDRRTDRWRASLESPPALGWGINKAVKANNRTFPLISNFVYGNTVFRKSAIPVLTCQWAWWGTCLPHGEYVDGCGWTSPAETGRVSPALALAHQNGPSNKQCIDIGSLQWHLQQTVHRYWLIRTALATNIT